MPPLQAGRYSRLLKPHDAVWPAPGSPDPRHRVKVVTVRGRDSLIADF
jgi:hypothetical protein